MSDLPNIIKIDGLDVKIVQRPLDGNDGEFSPADLAIYINRSLASYALEKRVLVHEIVHAIFYISARGVSDYIQEMANKDKIEEIVAEQIGERLYRVVDENPCLRRYLGWE